MDNIELIKSLGFPAAICIAGGWFFAKRIWPWMTAQIEALNKERREILEPIKESIITSTDIHRAVAAQMTQMTKLLEEIRNDRDGGKHAKPGVV